MRRYSIYLTLIFLAVAFSCKHDDPKYPTKVTVMLEGTSSPCPLATVRFGEGYAFIDRTLKTGVLGTVSTTFDLPAIIEASAVYTSDSITFYEGSAVIRLKADELVTKTIYVKKVN